MHRTRLLSFLIAVIVRAVAWTWRVRLDDLSGVTSAALLPPVIWVLWHNRLLVVPVLYERFLRHRKGAALISRSKDGGLLAACIERFGGKAVRGSSSRGGSAALAELKRNMSEGYDAYITPDGPRGPRYSLAPGVLWLAQSSGATIQPVRVEYSRCWRLGRWDGFVIPKPFSRVSITLCPFHPVPFTANAGEFQEERERLRGILMAGTTML